MSPAYTSKHHKTTSNILASSHTAAQMLPRIYRSQMSKTNTTHNNRASQMLPWINRS